MDNVWTVDADSEPVYVAYSSDPFDYDVVPAIRGGKVPPPNQKQLILTNGNRETSEDTRQKKFYALYKGDKVIDFTQGGCGVGNPLDRDTEAVKEDVRDGLVSVERAREDYGVIIEPCTFDVNQLETENLREKR